MSGYHYFFISISLFVLDTLAFLYWYTRKSPNDWQRISSTRIHYSPKVLLGPSSPTWPDGSIIMPVVCHRHISSNLIFITRYSSLPELQSTANQFLYVWDFVAFVFRLMTYLLMWLTLITITTGMYLVNGYSVIKVHTHSSKHKKNRWGDLYPFTCFLT